MNNKDKNFYFGSLIVLLIGIIVLLLAEYTDFPFVKSLSYFAWAAVIIPLVGFIELGIKILITPKDNKKDDEK